MSLNQGKIRTDPPDAPNIYMPFGAVLTNTALRVHQDSLYGLADMAYIAIGALTVSAIAALAYILVMATVSYTRCTHIVDVGEGTRAAIACTFDPLPVGQAAGLIFGAFAALIGALAGYMAATRRATSAIRTDTRSATQVIETPVPVAPVAPAAPPSKPKPKPKGKR